jgi:hypothetical protein
MIWWCLLQYVPARMSRRPRCIRFDLPEVEAKLEYLFIHFISHEWDSRWSRKEMPPV